MDKKHDSDFETNNHSKQKGFLSYVFEYNESKKIKLIKIAQYVTLGFIFYSIFLNIINTYFPKIDETCSSIEIIITLLLYLYIFFYAVYYIDRIICYSDTFFGYTQCFDSDNRDISVFDIVTPALLSILSFNPQFQDGIIILSERISEAWNGNEKKQKKKNKSNQQKQQQQQQMVSQTPITSSLYSGNTTPINQLPVLQEGFTQQQPIQLTQPVQQQMQGQMQGQLQEPFAPMAANEVVGSSFGSLF
jgi:DNA polymerase II large subunit